MLLLIAATGCSRSGGQPEGGEPVAALPFRNLDASMAFVGDDACFSCHEAEYTGYKQHGMANSLFKLDEDTWIESVDGSIVTDSSSGLSYRIFERDGQHFQEEFRLDAAGGKIHSQTREMQYVMGSGISARSYFVWNNGWFFQLPVTWYTQERKWDFSPGYRNANKRFDRKVLPRCLVCHNAYPTEVPFTDGKYEKIPLGISCERCHGPGLKHVEERLAFPEADSVDYSIVNPAHLTLERRLDICQQCHLNPTISLLREGRTPYDFRPSQSVKDYLALFEVETPETNEEIGLTSHVGRMKRSACYVGSLALGSPLECTTCHDPHSGFRSAGPDYFNKTCATCHEGDALRYRLITSDALPDHDAGSNCISCHMPKADVTKVAHSNFTDHWVRVVGREEAPKVAVVQNPPGLLPLFDSDEEGGVYEGLAYIVYGTQYQDEEYLLRGVSNLTASLSEDSQFGEAHFLLGLAYTQLDRDEEAILPLERAVTLDPGIPERLNALAQAYEATGRDPTRIGRLYERALAIQPARSDIAVNYGRFLETRGRLDEAASQYSKAILEEPWFATAHYNLGTLLLRRGEVTEAETSLREALALDPLDPQAWGNLGILYTGLDRQEDALRAFQSALEVGPDHPVALGNLGTHYLRMDSLSMAIPLLARAVELAPDYIDARVNLALAYFRNDEFGEAKREADAVLRLVPDHPLARQILDAI